ncbi:MAG: transglutaminase-like domain-containing protein, partial [Candidatus Latescibacterota bacterium]
MHRTLTFFAILLISAAQVFAAPTCTTSWSADAKKLYDEGFMHMLKRGPDGVTLFDCELMENDSPGAGHSEKGIFVDVVWGKNRARKIFNLDDVRARDARIVVYLVSPFGKQPLKFTVNGHTVEYQKWNTSEYYMSFYSLEIDPSWLKKGRNVVDAFCPEAQSEKEGWKLLIARADEFEAGGGSPADVGKTSFKSTDNGESWKESPFGPLGQTRAEYTVRISLDRYVRTGWLASPVIDLWRGDSDAFYVSQHRLSRLAVDMDAEVPAGTKVEYFLRVGTNPSPFSSEWGPYQLVGSGSRLEYATDGSFTGRYIQIRAVLSTDDPLRSPIINGARVNAEFTDPFPYPEHQNIYIVAVDNPPLRYSSLDWEWEKWDRPEFKELRTRENLDEVIAGCQTEFEAQAKLLDYATKRWTWQSPEPGYPDWNALAILNRINKTGGGGMCIQFNNYLAGLCMCYGWQARLVNVDGHEVCEVWNDEFGKWIYLDATHYNHYLYDKKNGVPMSMLDIHRAYLDFFFPGKSVDWTNYRRGNATPAQVDSIVGRGSLTRHKIGGMAGFTNG